MEVMATLILQISKTIAINAAQIESMVVSGEGGAYLATTITMRNSRIPHVVQGDWMRIWRTAIERGAVWADRKTIQLRT